MDFIELALRGKKEGFEKVIKLIDEMVVTLKTEQQDDDHKKEYCEVQIDKLEDKKKELEHDVSDLESLIADLTEKITTTTAEIEALEDGIKQLDKDVAEATDNRKEENDDFKTLMASNAAAKDLLGMAKNRMNKFYNPSLYQPALNQLHEQDEEAPPPPPEAVKAYAKKSDDGHGVIAMMDGLMAELQTEMTTAEVDEKNAQEEYEQFMSDSAEKRADDTKLLIDKTAAKADMEGALVKAKKDKAGKVKELMATAEVLSDVHGDCDWLLENFDLRETARANEVDSLKKAHAILSGADYSLVQQVSTRALRGHAS
jgi:chromosome segregation ATPase